MPNPSDKAMRVKQVYSELDRKFEEQETQRRAQQQNIPYINLYGFPVETQALNLVEKERAEALQAAVFFKEGRNIKLGVVNSNEKINPLIKNLTEQSYFVEPYLISQSSFDHLLDGYSKLIKTTHKTDKIDIQSTDSRFQASSMKELAAKLSHVSATEMIETIVGAALNVDASDVHVEPENADIKVRFRIDGVLQDVASMNKDLHHQFISRIKILSKLKLNVTTTPQDGSLGLSFNGQQVDLRVSILPSAFGESVVMRILRQDKGTLSFDDLGIMGLARERVLQEMEKPNGMLLTTGPTGSGKTTSLYAMLNKLNEPGVKIITLEDPVEYKISGVTQTPIDARAGMTFAEGLRAVLRQDPDIVMVGEMRDLETAEIACQAALTGHIVLSTLHTNDAPAAIPRLLDLGVRPFVLAPAINAIIGQRLVRKICSDCKQVYTPAEGLISRVEAILKSIPKSAKVEFPKTLNFTHSVGCEKCNGLGYKGRLGVYEVFIISEAIEEMINRGATATEVKKQAVEEGMLSMAQDGILKALQGLTDIEEVFRVTQE